MQKSDSHYDADMAMIRIQALEWVQGRIQDLVITSISVQYPYITQCLLRHDLYMTKAFKFVIRILMIFTLITIYFSASLSNLHRNAQAILPANRPGLIFESRVNLSNDRGNSSDPDVSTTGNNVYVVWQDTMHDNRTHSLFSTNYSIMFKKSTDGGLTFGDPVNLTKVADTHISGADNPHVASSGSKVYVIWTSSSRILLKVSDNNGTNFGDAVVIARDSMNRILYRSDIAASGNNVYLAWCSDIGNYTSRDLELFFQKSTDGGLTFGDPLKLSNNGKAYDPTISVYNNSLYVAWTDTTGKKEPDGVFLRRSLDGGNSFTNTSILSNNDGAYPTIASFGSNVYVAWQAGESSLGPVLARLFSNSSSIHSTSTKSSPNIDVYFTKSEDSGTHFGKVKNLSNNSGDSYSPTISVSGNNVYFSWAESQGFSPLNILLRTSNNSGASFSETINLSNSDEASLSQRMVSLGNRTYIVWKEDLNPQNSEIFFMRMHS